MVTPENSALNVRTAGRNVRARLGLPDDQKEWSYAQRAAYNKALAEEILRYPLSFTAQTLETAILVSGKDYGSLGDPSISWGEFAAVGAAVAVPVLSGFADKLLVILALAAVVYFAFLAASTRPRS